MTLVGARAFKDRTEVDALLAEISGEWRWRNRALIVCGCRTGLRISELLSWSIGDVFDGRKLKDFVYTRRSKTKGKREGRRLPLHPEAKHLIAKWLVDLRRRGIELHHDRPLFCGREARFCRAIGRKSAHRIVAEAARKAGLEDGVGTHSWRKFLALTVYERSGHCLIRTGAILGHRNISTTWRYCRSVAVGAEQLLLD